MLLMFLITALSASCRKLSSGDRAPDTNAILSPFRLQTPIPAQASITMLSMLIDSRQHKWITYRALSGLAGIIQFDGNTGQNYPNANSSLPLITNGNVIAQTEDAGGAVYFTSNSGDYFQNRLFRYQAGTWEYWDIAGIPAREVYFNPGDNKLYFVYRDIVHRIATTADFSRFMDYERVIFDLPDSPEILQSNFDGKEIHFMSHDRYFVISPDGEVLAYTTPFDDIIFRYMHASDASKVYVLGGFDQQHIYKLHEGRCARFPLANVALRNITVDNDNSIYVITAGNQPLAGKYEEGNIHIFTYGDENKQIVSPGPVVVDNQNVKWVAVPEGLLRLP